MNMVILIHHLRGDVGGDLCWLGSSPFKYIMIILSQGEGEIVG